MRIFLAISSMFLLTAFGSCSSSNNTVKEGQKSKSNAMVETSSSDEVVYGEYLILTVTKPDMEKLRIVFKPLVFSEFKAISHNVIKIKLDKDPGLKALKDKSKNCKDIKEIEPNRIVRIPTPVK